MRHGDAVVLEARRPRLGVAGRGEDDLHAFVHDDLHDLIDLRVHQRHVYAERSIGGGAAFANMLAEGLGVHRSGAEQSESAGVAHGRGQSPATAPHHPALNDGVFDIKQRSDSIHIHTELNTAAKELR